MPNENCIDEESVLDKKNIQSSSNEEIGADNAENDTGQSQSDFEPDVNEDAKCSQKKSFTAKQISIL